MAANGAQTKRDVFLDCDPGHDDAMAIVRHCFSLSLIPLPRMAAPFDFGDLSRLGSMCTAYRLWGEQLLKCSANAA